MTNAFAMDLVRDNFCRKVSWVADRHPLMKVVRAKQYLAVDCGLASDTFNSAVWLHDRIEPGDRESLETVTRHFMRENRPLAFWVWDRPGLDSEGLFESVGFEKAETNTAMWADADRLKGETRQSELLIQPVSSVRDIVEYGENMSRLFAGTSEEGPVREYHSGMLSDVLLRDDQAAREERRGLGERMLLYVGRADGRPVTTGLLFLAAGSAGIYDIATREDARKRGFGTAMFRFLLEEGKKAGATRFVLQASPDGLSIYERAGFQAVGDVLVFERAARAGTPLPSSSVWSS